MLVGNGDASVDGEDLKLLAADDIEGPDGVENAMNELKARGVLLATSLIQEKRDKLAAMPPPRQIFLEPASGRTPEKNRELGGAKTTEVEQSYFRLRHEIARYDSQHNEHPERFEGWDTPRYRLKDGFLRYIEETQP